MSQLHHPASSSTRTSLTFFEPAHDSLETQQGEFLHTHIAEITSRIEEKIEHYGGDDIHEPPAKELIIRRSSPLPVEPTLDANMVTWDGPDDPKNPQNWSIKYKWLVTIVCTIMTVNV